MSDDDTPRERPSRRRSEWGDDRRAAVGREHRGGESGASIASERRKRGHPHGVPVVPDAVERELGGPGEIIGEAHEITEPWEILDRDLLPDEENIVRRSKRPSGDPLTVEDGAKMLRRFIRKELDDRSEKKRRADEYMAILDTTPSGRLAARVDVLERASKDADKDADLRLKTLEKDATFARNAAMSTLVFLILSVGAAGIWIGIREEKLANLIETVRDLRQHSTQSKDNTP